jgi:dipeptidyl aminopeptidase/acylaminoacyl peptidase
MPTSEWSAHFRAGLRGTVAFACAVLMLSCTTAPSARSPGSSGTPSPSGSGTSVETWGGAAVVYGRGTDELHYDSTLHIMRLPPGAGESTKDLRRPVPVTEVACSPDGARVLVMSQRYKTRWWLVNRDGTGLRELDVSQRGMETGDIWWVPDGRSLLVLRRGPGTTSLTRHFLASSAQGPGTVQTVILSSAGRYISTVAVSPDGRRLLMSVWDELGTESAPKAKSSLWMVPMPGGPRASTPRPTVWREIATSRSLSFSDAVWSPDGRWIALAGGLPTDNDRGYESTAQHIYLMRPDGSRLHRVPGLSNRNTSSYQWLPGGRTLAFLTGDYRNEDVFDRPSRLALLRVDTGDTRILTTLRHLDGYAVSPDGRAVLALTGERLMVQPIAAGGEPRVVDRGGYFGGWSWCAGSSGP